MREMVSRSTFSCRSWDHRVGTKHRMTTRQRTRRAELFMVELIMVQPIMMSAPEWESTGDYTSSDLRVGAADCPGDYEDFSPSSLSWLLFGCRYLFVVLRIDREKQEVIKGVLPVVDACGSRNRSLQFSATRELYSSWETAPGRIPRPGAR